MLLVTKPPLTAQPSVPAAALALAAIVFDMFVPTRLVSASASITVTVALLAELLNAYRVVLPVELAFEARLATVTSNELAPASVLPSLSVARPMVPLTVTWATEVQPLLQPKRLRPV